jgi:hypothetical protein
VTWRRAVRGPSRCILSRDWDALGFRAGREPKLVDAEIIREVNEIDIELDSADDAQVQRNRRSEAGLGEIPSRSTSRQPE